MTGRAGAARVHYRVASALEFWGWPAGAVQAYRDALRVDPGFADAQFRLGELLGRRGRWLEACGAFRESARLRPSSAEIQGNLVLALGRVGRWSEAADALERLIHLRPSRAELHVLRGTILGRLGRREEAIRSFRWAVRLTPSPDWSRFFLGAALVGRRGWADVTNAFEGAVALQEREPEAPGLLAARDSALNHRPAPESAAPIPRRRLLRRLPSLKRIGALGLGVVLSLAPILLGFLFWR